MWRLWLKLSTAFLDFFRKRPNFATVELRVESTATTTINWTQFASVDNDMCLTGVTYFRFRCLETGLWNVCSRYQRAEVV